MPEAWPHAWAPSTSPEHVNKAGRGEWMAPTSLTCLKAFQAPRPLRLSMMTKYQVTVKHRVYCCGIAVPNWCKLMIEVCMSSCTSMMVGVTTLYMCSLSFDESEVKLLTAAGKIHSTKWPRPIHGMWRSWKYGSPEFIFAPDKFLAFSITRFSTKTWLVK